MVVVHLTRSPDIARLAERGDVRRLVHALHRRAAAVRVDAAQALADVGSVEARDALASVLSADDSAEVCRTAAFGLARLGDPRAARLLPWLLHEGDPDRERARAALLGLGPAAVESLIAALEVDRLRPDAIALLGELGDERAVEPLELLFEDEARSLLEDSVRHEGWGRDRFVRRQDEIVGALLKIGSRQAVPWLKERLGRRIGSFYPPLAVTVIRTLVAWGDPPDGRMLVTAAEAALEIALREKGRDERLRLDEASRLLLDLAAASGDPAAVDLMVGHVMFTWESAAASFASALERSADASLVVSRLLEALAAERYLQSADSTLGLSGPTGHSHQVVDRVHDVLVSVVNKRGQELNDLALQALSKVQDQVEFSAAFEYLGDTDEEGGDWATEVHTPCPDDFSFADVRQAAGVEIDRRARAAGA